MTGEKEKIFRRIREALSVPAPYPGHHGEKNHHRPPATSRESEGQRPDSSQPRVERGTSAALGNRPNAESPVGVQQSPDGTKDFAHWLPSVGPTFDAQADLFARNSVQLKSSFHLLDSESAASQKLAEISAAESWRRVASHGDGASGASTRAIVSTLKLPGIWTDSGYDVREMENCDAGISECDALVAQTGSVLVTARSAGGRALSVLPPHHVVLARRAQLVPDLPAAFALLETKYAGNFPSFISFITGPSRTGDIERILVLGAHGPKKLTILCW